MMSTTVTETTKKTKAATAKPVYTHRATRNFSGDGVEFRAGDLVPAALWPEMNVRAMEDTGFLRRISTDPVALAEHVVAEVGRRVAELDAREKATRDGGVELGKEEGRHQARLAEIEKLVAEGEEIRKRLIGIRDERNGAERVLAEMIPQERARLARLRDEAAAVLEAIAS